MKPQRLTLTNHLVLGYGLHKDMDVYQPRAATEQELETFHEADYVDFLSKCASLQATFLASDKRSTESPRKTSPNSPMSSPNST